MADYKSYLAASILTEDKIVTYRLLSRALKVHVNAAKEMLYEFHKQQNAKKPQSIHATYLLSGTKRKEEPTDGEAKKDNDGDNYMQSSPIMSSSMPMPEEDYSTVIPPVLSITLVREEDLEKIRAQYEEINSIHVYSLEPSPLKDLQVLSDITRQLTELCASEDPLETNIKYGIITNPNAKRRSARRPPLPVAAVPVMPKSEAAKPKVTESKPPPPKKEEPKLKSATANDFFGKGKEKTKPKAADKGSASSKESTPIPPTLKRQGSSLMAAFSKSKPKLKHEGTDSSAVASPVLSAAADSPMKDVFDDEEETYVPPPSKVNVEESRKARKDREAALRKMMDESDGDDEPPKPEPEEKSEEESQPKARSESPTKEDPPIVSGGRRRGKRRVTKKKVMKDEDGYLVTKEEAIWESFSEDEPVAKPKPKPLVSSTTAGKKKAPPKAGQGNIMSFFGKK
ncbi:hypothetical protein GLAREA_08206 [Glarea lozoyensis ATCC 20868]|uniref:DNA polymerase delta subunit 3 n=2 Tax=Glarea lozoyensis TaxID=101852 RepID=S3CGH6_GLAL2|nr:uncharacterized protein GLAREA_08206 [Glarea lozoyensis ATCC 20868]EPE24354.1 hypothetical protein GLAREA_08206 [Glarea lozoyensis ATCC 20868]